MVDGDKRPAAVGIAATTKKNEHGEDEKMQQTPRLLLSAFALLLGTNVSACAARSAEGPAHEKPDAPPEQPSWTVTSPGKALTARIQRDDAGTLSYRVVLGNGAEQTPLVASSPLGIAREDAGFVEALRVVSERRRTVEHAYTLAHGKHRQVRGEARELTITVANADGDRVELIVRAYDGGAAFRYRFPAASPGDTTRHTVAREISGFRLPEGATGWMMPYDEAAKWSPAYENRYRRVEAGTPSPTGLGWGYPALFHIGDDSDGSGPWVLLTEAGLGRQYAGTHLEWDSTAAAYRTRFPEPDEAEGLGAVHPSATLPWATPWRVIVAGRNLGGIVESALSTHLNPPSKLRDPSWVEPGISSWSWWSDGQSPTNPAALRNFVDLSAQMGWRYSLVDLNWHKMPKDTLRALVDYADARDVELMLWYNSGGPHNPVQGGPRDRLMDAQERRAEFRWLQDLGVAGIKVDFFNSDKQKIIRHYLDILDDAADFELMINTHGSTIPRGWHRSYPHLMTMEAVRGAEFYRAEASYAERAPRLNTILPFTRNVVGPMDYTPVTFSDAKHPHQTTDAHELALSVVFASGLQHFADRASAYRDLPTAPKAFLKQVPAAWDETRFLTGHPGRYVVLARRKGNAWYVGGINGTDETRRVAVDLSFLEKARAMTLIRDGAGDNRFAVEERTARPGNPVSVTMPPNGGFVMRLALADGSG
jgi:hypothetical protein